MVTTIPCFLFYDLPENKSNTAFFRRLNQFQFFDIAQGFS
ncbi:hypothetical protein SC1083_1391 [Aggregatibacter actinomycetemcomitans serotype e str. SC1083]|uniref:Uncharacterized protein n=1 Tax=Aggregatibacter actinomycetemcomitans serotype e str. SC1083 TaxID=907488 RepID=G4A981_AGGAC|nr:hypothetical protein SC1083_1391 [Aggregatibacter actinomycetemcomitans serotype e str. SC1083]